MAERQIVQGYKEAERIVLKDGNINKNEKNKIIGELRKAKEEAMRPLDWDVWIYRIAVMVLGFVVLAAVVGAIWLNLADKSIPELLIALGSASIGAIAGLLSPTPRG